MRDIRASPPRGAGDTLAGLLARGSQPRNAALWGVSLHGAAGRRLALGRGFRAREIPSAVPPIIAEIPA